MVQGLYESFNVLKIFFIYKDCYPLHCTMKKDSSLRHHLTLTLHFSLNMTTYEQHVLHTLNNTVKLWLSGPVRTGWIDWKIESLGNWKYKCWWAKNRWTFSNHCAPFPKCVRVFKKVFYDLKFRHKISFFKLLQCLCATKSIILWSCINGSASALFYGEPVVADLQWD